MLVHKSEIPFVRSQNLLGKYQKKHTTVCNLKFYEIIVLKSPPIKCSTKKMLK